MLFITETTVADALMNFHRILDRLEADAPLVSSISENQSNSGLHAHSVDEKPKEQDISALLSYYDGLDGHDTPFIKRYDDVVLLLQRVTDCMQHLPQTERIILQRIYLERMGVDDVAFHMRMTTKDLYDKRTEAIKQLTQLVMNTWTISE